MADLILRGVDPDQLRDAVADAVVAKLQPIICEASQPHLVDRTRMAELLCVSIPKLDRMVSDGMIPSKLVGTRRLFEPRRVIDALPSDHEKREASQ